VDELEEGVEVHRNVLGAKASGKKCRGIKRFTPGATVGISRPGWTRARLGGFMGPGAVYAASTALHWAQRGKAAGAHMEIGFLLNGEAVRAEGPPTRTLLDWLREERG
jgi:hypothetical protein